MKLTIALAVFGFTLTALSSAFAQSPQDVVGQPGYATQTTGIGTTSKNASAAAPAGTPSEESNTAEHDDTLYRGKTDELESSMLRDDGMLHFKSRPKEKTHQVDSLKSLQSSGTDPKFQGEFAVSGVNSIDKIAAKPTEEHAAKTEKPADQNEPPSDSRFVRRHLTFSPPPDDKPKKAEADSSPSPTPSPTASPTGENSGKSKE